MVYSSCCPSRARYDTSATVARRPELHPVKLHQLYAGHAVKLSSHYRFFCTLLQRADYVTWYIVRRMSPRRWMARKALVERREVATPTTRTSPRWSGTKSTSESCTCLCYADSALNLLFVGDGAAWRHLSYCFYMYISHGHAIDMRSVCHRGLVPLFFGMWCSGR